MAPGVRLGGYEIITLLGAGGMGEVYRARDTKLNRDVALKILPATFAADPDRLARFTREAQVLAALNHPHIAHIHGLEDDGAVRALVMELVEGEDLAQRMARHPMPLDEALPIARQIADALEAAHAHGIIHRDLKPANVKVRADGTVKVLDFGLAKALDPLSSSPAAAALANSPTLTSPAAMTAVGVILGTAAYMSPEQARGKPLDKRTDIWSFGCLLFEMLTGVRAFPGDDVTETLAHVITKDVDWSVLPSATPLPIRKLLRRCLEKDRTRRLADIADARLEIDEALTPSPGDGSDPRVAAHAVSSLPVLPWAVAGALGAALIFTVAFLVPGRRAPASAPLRLSAELGAEISLADQLRGPVAILSPDSSAIAFVARTSPDAAAQLYVRRLTEPRAALFSGTLGADSPFYAPDGQWIAFFAGGKLKKISVTGGAAVTLCDAPNGRGGSWYDDGTIVFTPDSPTGVSLQRVSAAGGQPEPLTSTAGDEVLQRWPQILPGGKAVLYTGSATTAFNDANIVVQPIPSGARKIVQRGGHYGRYVASGHLVYVRDGILYAAPFDLARLEVTGPAVRILDGVMSNPQSGGAQFSVSANGTLVYIPGRFAGRGAPMHWLDYEGKTTLLRSAPADWSRVRFAPDGRRLAMDIRDGQQLDIWIYEWARDTLTRLTFDPANDVSPVWTLDGRRVVFGSHRGDTTTSNLYWQLADGTGEVQRLTESKNPQYPTSWHPSGKMFAYYENNAQTLGDLMILPMEGDATSGWKPGKPSAFLRTPFDERDPMFSPDGRWVAYSSNESGRAEVYVRPFPGPGGKWQVSTAGGVGPTWSHTKHELLYATPDGQFMVAAYSVEGDAFRTEKPRLWADTHVELRAQYRMFDLHPDDQRFAVALADAPASGRQDHATFIFNFFDELRRLAPPAKR